MNKIRLKINKALYQTFDLSVVMWLARIPGIRYFLFFSADDIFESEIYFGVIKNLQGFESELERTRTMIEYGRFLRNRYLLWHPSNPYTMKRFNNSPDSPFHPDNYSQPIVERVFIVANGHEQQIHSDN